MKNVIGVNAEEVVEQSGGNYFMIVLTTDSGRELVWRGNGFSQLADGFFDVSLFRKQNAVNAYYDALRDAKIEDRPSLFQSGRLDLVPLPKWG